MARPFSMDLKKRIVAAHTEGASISEVAKRFDVSYWTVRNYVKRAAIGELEAKPLPGKPRRLDAQGMELLREQVENNPDWTLAEHSAALEEQGIILKKSAIHNYFKRMKISYKKNA